VRRIGILGTGLIGTSIGLAARTRGGHVTAWDPAGAHLSGAVDRGAVDVAAPDVAAVLAASADLLVVAAPPSATVALVSDLDHPGLTIDVAGVKGPVVAANRLPRFVGTHPMAGRETTGPGAASAALFRGASWVIVGDGAAPADVALIEEFVKSLGATPIRMTAEAHDAAVAAISHVPQLLASGLVATAAETPGALDLAAGSFRDLTRVASSEAELWVDVLQSNREAVGAALRAMRNRLDALGSLLEGDPDGLAASLRRSRDVRRSMATRVATVRVALADQPGELARVGRALEASAVDVRDIQLRHAPHGGGGVLTVSVRPGHAEALVHALEVEGLLVIE
jgi:prephenate dehydrogenase